jgi:hypothetical protein
MANIDLHGFYEQKQREFNMEGTGSERFDSDFIDACNRARRVINRKADLASTISMITSIDDTNVGLDEDYEDVFSYGVSLFLKQMGQRPQPGAENETLNLETFYDMIGSIAHKIRNDLQDANADDDEENDIIGHGYVS